MLTSGANVAPLHALPTTESQAGAGLSTSSSCLLPPCSKEDPVYKLEGIDSHMSPHIEIQNVTIGTVLECGKLSKSNPTSKRVAGITHMVRHNSVGDSKSQPCLQARRVCNCPAEIWLPLCLLGLGCPPRPCLPSCAEPPRFSPGKSAAQIHHYYHGLG